MKIKDIIAGLTILGIFGLKFSGYNGGLDSTLAIILGYYFAKRHSGIDSGK